jgi:hypothetical protein
VAWLDSLLSRISNVFSTGQALPQRSAVNFTGSGVSVSDDPVNLRTNVNITGGGIAPVQGSPIALVSGLNDNISIPGGQSSWHFSQSANTIIGGFAPSTAPIAGQFYDATFATSQTSVTIRNLSATSGTSNQIVTPTGQDLILPPGQNVRARFLFNGTNFELKDSGATTVRTVSVADFGAYPSNSGSVNGPLLQTAITFAANNGYVLEWPPGSTGIYLTAQHLVVPDVTGFKMRAGGNFAQGDNVTVIVRASAAMTSVLEVPAGPTFIEGIKFDANNLATYGVTALSAGFSRYSECAFINAIVDGLNIALGDFPIFDNCSTQGNGRIYCSSSAVAAQYSFITDANPSMAVTMAGTLTTDSSNPRLVTISGAGAPDLTTLGIRYGDGIRFAGSAGGAIDDTAIFFQICEVISPTQLILAGYTRLPPTATAYTAWAIHVGDGLHTGGSTDNSANNLRGGVYELNAGSGLALVGSWNGIIAGSKIEGNAALQYNGFAGVLAGVPFCGEVFGSYTFHVIQNSINVTASSSMTGVLAPGIFIEFTSQSQVKYTIATVSGTAITLTEEYTGTTETATSLTFDTVGAEVSGLTVDTSYHEANVAAHHYMGFLVGGVATDVQFGNMASASATVLYDPLLCSYKLTPSGIGPGILGSGGSSPAGETEEISIGEYISSVPSCGQGNQRTGFIVAYAVVDSASFQFNELFTYHWLDPDGSYVLTSTPTVPAPPNGLNQLIRILNSGYGGWQFIITLQDTSVLSGSLLLLKTPTLSIPPGGWVELNYDPSIELWVETNRSGCAESTYLTTASSTYTVDENIGYDIHPDGTVLLSGSAFTATLPNPALWGGRKLKFKATASSATTYTLAPHASETIDGASSYAITVKYGCVELTCDGTNWWVTGSYNGTVI